LINEQVEEVKFDRDEMEDSDEGSSFTEGLMDEGIFESFTRSRKIDVKESRLNRNLKNLSFKEKQRTSPNYWDY
jgi:hypothetical protein